MDAAGEAGAGAAHAWCCPALRKRTGWAGWLAGRCPLTQRRAACRPQYVTLANQVTVGRRRVGLALAQVKTQDKRRFLWPWELWPWPRPCTNTSFAQNVLMGALP